MTFTKDAVTITGGCNCRAIRYRVSVPPFASRPPTPYRTPGADIGDLRIPCVLLCHCNNCRLGANSILPIGLVTETRTVTASILSNSTTTEGAISTPDSYRIFSPAIDFFDHRKPASDIPSPLMAYRSSSHCSRWFCARCGTSVAYSVNPDIIPAEWNWPTMLDLWSATIDREYLEKDYMAPERMVWCHFAVPWVQRLAREGAGGVPEHPLTKIDKVLGDHVEGDLRELEGLGEKVSTG